MKAILVIDMPENCIDCPLHQRYCGAVCRALEKEHTDDRFYQKEEWCPLRPMPNKLPLESGSIMNTFKESTKYKHIGWNDCLDEIMGETE